jgi:hypothetical protein
MDLRLAETVGWPISTIFDHSDLSEPSDHPHRPCEHGMTGTHPGNMVGDGAKVQNSTSPASLDITRLGLEDIS